MNPVSLADINVLCRPGNVIAVEYLKKGVVAEIISDAEGGGKATHALCCLGGLDIVEASITGVIESNLRNYLRGNCRLTIREAIPAPLGQDSMKAVRFWLARVNDPYDWGMIFGMAPILFAKHVIGFFSESLSEWVIQKMPNLLASSKINTCAELAVRGMKQFSLISFRAYNVENIDPEILRTDSSVNTKAVLDAAVLID